MASKLPKCPLCGATVKVESVIWGMVKCSKCFYLVTGQIHRALAAQGKVLWRGKSCVTHDGLRLLGLSCDCPVSSRKLHDCRRVVVSEEAKP